MLLIGLEGCHTVYWYVGKGGFFLESAIRFSNLQKTILSLKLKFPANNTLLLLAVMNIKCQVQDSFLEYFF